MKLPWPRLVFLIAVATVVAGLLVAVGGLTRPPAKDEVHFWPTSVAFSETLFPSVELLRGYNELNTPLPFIVFGLVEHLTHLGIGAGRAINLLMMLAIIALVGWPRRDDDWHRPRAALGLLLFPYFLGTGLYLYTDMMAAFFGVIGVWAHRDRLPLLAAACFMLAVATRQYMVALPLAAAAATFLESPRAGTLAQPRFVLPVLAAATLGFWFWLFGGPAPATALAAQGIATADLAALRPAHGLYFLACIGAYYVVPEAVLFADWRARGWRELVPIRGLALAMVVIALFIFFPPLANRNYEIPAMGYLDRALRSVLGDVPRMIVLGALAALCAMRFHRADLATTIIALNALILTKAHIGWDKYALPVIAVLWLLRAESGSTPAVRPTRATPQKRPIPAEPS